MNLMNESIDVATRFLQGCGRRSWPLKPSNPTNVLVKLFLCSYIRRRFGLRMGNSETIEGILKLQVFPIWVLDLSH